MRRLYDIDVIDKVYGVMCWFGTGFVLGLAFMGVCLRRRLAIHLA